MAKLLLVEDDAALADTVVTFLRRQGHYIDWAADGKAADDLIRFYQYELLLLDWVLPQTTGLDILRSYRERGGKASVLLLTSRSSVAEKMQGLDVGADDYLTKPFSLDELGARVRALLRRGTEVKSAVMRLADLEIDTASRTVKRGQQSIRLSPLEFTLLEFLVRHKGQMFTHEALLNRVWESDSDAPEAMVRVTVNRLRRKLSDDSEKPLIRTVYGEGYIADDCHQP